MSMSGRSLILQANFTRTFQYTDFHSQGDRYFTRKQGRKTPITLYCWQNRISY
ncbi:hypothetical protein [Calothrix sp. NIES-2100]|uniref:hypothetical protein n=1 Tax=Calothrix sp. NIES-2100 TaxID=1954172 RepID=UPI0030D6EE0D